MLTSEDNELLTRVGPGTPMGDLMRQYWIPVLLSSELKVGERVKRVRLLGEELVAFRARNGRVGLLKEACSHRRASLYFGRIEEEGLRCVYHGWLYGIDGKCLDMPNEAPETTFKHTVQHPAYPCVDRGGVIWTYMGTSKELPGLPEFEWTMTPENHRFISKYYQQCNYFQAMEGGIDSSHISFLHAPLDPVNKELVQDINKSGFGIGDAVQTFDKSPRFEVVDTDYGVLIGARRSATDERYYWRVTQFLMPFTTMPPADLENPIFQSHMWVPSDDQHLINWCISWHPTRPLTEEEVVAFRSGKGTHITEYAPPTSEPCGDIRPAANRSNDYFMDWEAHRTRLFCGIPGFGMQDRAIQESQGPIYDRTRERLGTSDTAIIQVRKRLLGAAKALREQKMTPPGVHEPASYRVRGGAFALLKDVMWVDVARERLVGEPDLRPSAD